MMHARVLTDNPRKDLHMSETELPAVAFLGIGLMGAPMAARLLAAGYRVTVWNRSITKTDPLVKLGASRATMPGEAVRDASMVITMLDSGPVVSDVVSSAFPTAAPGTLWIDMSSTAQSEAVTLDALLRQNGQAFADAPVSGGIIGAEQGTLAIMVGGSIADFKRAESLLQVLGRPTRVGLVGCGQLTKLCNQLIVGATIGIVAEALLLAQAGGADPAAMRSAIRGGFAESRILEVHGQRMLERNFIPGGQVKSQAKDFDNVLRAAAESGLHLPIAGLVSAIYRDLTATLPTADHAAALLALEALNPGKRVGDAPDRLPVN